MRVQEIAVDVRPRWNAARLKSLLWLSLPLGLAMLFIQLRNTIPRMILEDVRGEAELGIFAAMAYLIIVGNTVVMALSQSSIARLARAYADDDATRFVSVTRKLVMVGALLGAGGILIAKLGGELLLTLLYKEEYAQQGDVFLVVMLAGGIYYVGTMFGPPATAAGAYREQLVIQGVHSVVLLISGYLLIPEYGMMGAAWTMVGGGIWVAVAYGVTVWRRVLLMRARSAT
jgi:O-antigen/teichoic acid export membrane protein